MIVCLDANIVIYLVEHNPVWTPRAGARVAVARAAGNEVAICEAARLECLTKPLASANATDAATYQAFFAGPSVRMPPVTPAVGDRAALFRATYHLKPLDAVHPACAVEQGCGLFLTNDTQLARCTAIPVEVLT
jgi:predicted nucleic acid-binding protein